MKLKRKLRLPEGPAKAGPSRLQRDVYTIQQIRDKAWTFPVTEAGAIFYPPEQTITPVHRTLLWRVWDKTKPRLVFIMLNPSIADEYVNDPTIKKCIKFAKREGCGGFYVVNLHTRRATEPDALLNCRWKTLSPDAAFYISKSILHAREFNWKVVVAWGSHKATKFGLRASVCNLSLGYGVPLYCFDINKDGNPKHPLYVKDNQPLKLWPRGADNMWR